MKKYEKANKKYRNITHGKPYTDRSGKVLGVELHQPRYCATTIYMALGARPSGHVRTNILLFTAKLSFL